MAKLSEEEIGEKMGALSHITSFWRFRFKDPNAIVDAEELVMVLQDLSKGFADPRSGGAAGQGGGQRGPGIVHGSQGAREARRGEALSA